MREASPSMAAGADGRQGARRRRWVVIAAVVYVVCAAVILVLPIGYGAIVEGIARMLAAVGIGGFGSGWVEFVANIAMFVPLGFLATLLTRHHWWGVVIAVALSVGVEVAQIVIPSRQPSLRDVLANGLGAAVGGALAWLFVLRRDARKRSVRTDASA